MTTDERIENLEKGLASARRLNRWLLAAVGLALGVWILAGTLGPATAAAPGSGGAVKEVRANRFVVEDENGNVRASLGMVKETVQSEVPGVVYSGPRLELFAENGKVRARLDVTTCNLGRPKDEPRLTLFDDNDKTRVTLASINTVGPTLSLHDAAGHIRATLDVDAAWSGLTLRDAADKDRIVLSMDGTGARLVMNDDAGKGRMALGMFAKGPGVLLSDAAGKNRALLHDMFGKGPEMRLFDAAGKDRAVLNVDADGPGLALTDAAGKERIGLDVGADGPALVLRDAAGKARAAVGVGKMVASDGRTITNPESSLMLMDAAERPIWKAP